MENLLENVHFLPPADEITSCVIVLPGRGDSGMTMALRYHQDSDLFDSLIVGVTPRNYAWYPVPKGPNNQQQAVAGLKIAVEAIQDLLWKIDKKYKLTPENIGIVGYSAGAVVAMETAARTERSFAAVVLHAGAILNMDNMPVAANQSMPILWMHRKDDDVFSWNDRYLPGKACLEKHKYNLQVMEEDEGGHKLRARDIKNSGVFLKTHLKRR